MVSGKGIMYTVLAAASTAVLAGTMLTKGERGQTMRKIGDSLRSFVGKRLSAPNRSSMSRQTENQVSMGHS